MDPDYEEWDRIYRRYPLGALPWELGRPRKVLVDLVEKGLIKRGKALDMCCGVGTNALYLTKKGFQVTGIDISPKAIEYAKEKARKANTRIQFQVQNFLNLPFEDEEFDFVFDMGCFHHVKIKDRSTFTRGIHRVLKKGGAYLMVCFSYRNGPAWNHFTKEQIMQLFSDHFKIKNIEHTASVEGDGYTRYFYSVLMKKE
jgi:ubiquinone/menaquinone biosynthesis C-methylase UbiE